MSVKFLHQAFTDKEFEKLVKAKGEKSWHDFILELVKDDKRGKETE